MLASPVEPFTLTFTQETRGLGMVNISSSWRVNLFLVVNRFAATGERGHFPTHFEWLSPCCVDETYPVHVKVASGNVVKAGEVCASCKVALHPLFEVSPECEAGELAVEVLAQAIVAASSLDLFQATFAAIAMKDAIAAYLDDYAEQVKYDRKEILVAP